MESSEPGTDFLPSDPREKALLCVGLLLYSFGCYYAIGLLGSTEGAATLNTAVDDWIPFVPLAMYLYSIVYTSQLIPLFVVRCQRLFRRVVLSYFVVVTLSFLVWLVFPVTSVGLRGDVTTLDLSVFHEWGLRLNYTLDPPLNLFPSLHQAVATIGAIACWKANQTYGVVAGAVALVIALAICMVKQHFFLDGLVGAALAAAVSTALLRDYEPGEDAPRVGYSWRGPAGYVAVHLGALAGLYVAFLAGWEPWA